MGKIIDYREIRQNISATLCGIGVVPSDDVMLALQNTLEAEKQAASSGYKAMRAIIENLEAAGRNRIPMCQDTGMVIVFADIGVDAELDLSTLDRAIEEGISEAYGKAYFRKSMVIEPVFARKNSGTNLPAVIYHKIVPGSRLKISLMMKGFGSENCSGLVMANPTAGEGGVIAAVRGVVEKAGGKPCPPIVVGVGIGGSADKAMLLSKRALLRNISESHSDPEYASLEKKILESVNELTIGPGGLGGTVTAMAVKIEHEATHIAGMPIGVSISCWADRKATILFPKAEVEPDSVENGDCRE